MHYICILMTTKIYINEFCDKWLKTLEFGFTGYNTLVWYFLYHTHILNERNASSLKYGSQFSYNILS